jgi:hypothetical protein
MVERCPIMLTSLPPASASATGARDHCRVAVKSSWHAAATDRSSTSDDGLASIRPTI